MGVYPLVQTPTVFSDTRTNTVTTNYIQTSTFARAIYDTSATSITINSYTDTDIQGTYPQFNELGLYVNGVYQKISPGVAGAKATVVALSAGAKRIQIVNGLQSFLTGVVQGTFLVSISANAGLAPVTGTTANRAVIYGDSIMAGGNATSPTGEAASIIDRISTPNTSVGVEAYGSRGLFTDCNGAPARAAFVAKIVAWNPAKLFMLIGTNDYGLSLQSAANFGTMYAALLTDLNTALPSLTIIAATPLLKNTDTTINAFSDALPAYRSAIATAVSGKGYVTLIDGTTLVGQQSSADGLHPNTDGHYGLGQYIKWSLGHEVPTASSVIANRVGTSVALQSLTGMYRITKTGAGGAFDADAIGSTGYTGDFYMKAIMRVSSDDKIVGMATNPSTDSGFANINYAIYFPAGTAATLYESNVSVLAGVATDIATPMWIIRIGTTLTYRRGYNPATATIVRTVTGVSGTLYFDSSLFQLGATVDASVYSAAP